MVRGNGEEVGKEGSGEVVPSSEESFSCPLASPWFWPLH